MQPIHRVIERHVSGDVLPITLTNQVSFFNRVPLERFLPEVPGGGHVLLDSGNQIYIRPLFLT